MWPGFSATAWAAAKAKRFDSPTTKVSNVYRGFGRDSRGSTGSAGRGTGVRAGALGTGGGHRREARRRIDDERDRHRLAHEAGHELLEEGAVVVVDEVAVERVRGRDLEPPALDRHEAERREPALVEVRAQPRAQERVDPRPELVHRRDHLGARARMHVAAPRRPRDETRLPPPTPGLPDGGSLGAQRARVQAASCCVGAEVSQGPSRGSRASFVARETTGFSRDGPATDRGGFGRAGPSPCKP